MLSLIRRLFVQEEKKLSLPELHHLVEQKKNTEETKLLADAQTVLIRIKELLHQLNKSADELARAPLVDEENIEKKVKTIVTSQRSFFVGQVKLFTSRLIIPENISKRLSIHDVKECGTLLENELILFTQKTAKSFAFAHHLFYRELALIKEILQQLDMSIVQYKKICHEQNPALQELAEVIMLVNKEKEILSSLLKKKDELMKYADGIKNHIDQIKKKGTETETGEIIYGQKKLEELEQRETQIKEEITTFFLKTKRQWQKVAKCSPEHEKEIKQLLTEPTATRYSSLYIPFTTALKKRMLGNEEYEKLLVLAHAFSPEILSALSNELSTIKKSKEQYAPSLSSHHQMKNVLKQEMEKIEKEQRVVQNSLEEIEAEAKMIPVPDMEKIAALASEIMKTKVVLYA